MFCFDPAVSIADEIAEEDNITADVGDDIEPNFTNQESATFVEGWDEVWLDLEEDTADMEGWHLGWLLSSHLDLYLRIYIWSFIVYCLLGYGFLLHIFTPL